MIRRPERTWRVASVSQGGGMARAKKSGSPFCGRLKKKTAKEFLGRKGRGSRESNPGCSQTGKKDGEKKSNPIMKVKGHERLIIRKRGR